MTFSYESIAIILLLFYVHTLPLAAPFFRFFRALARASRFTFLDPVRFTILKLKKPKKIRRSWRCAWSFTNTTQQPTEQEEQSRENKGRERERVRLIPLLFAAAVSPVFSCR
jgi:hypothetical protein